MAHTVAGATSASRAAHVAVGNGPAANGPAATRPNPIGNADDEDAPISFVVEPMHHKAHTVDTIEYVSRNARRPWYVIDPRTSRSSQTWDLFMAAALGFTAIVTPVEVAFFTLPTSWFDGLFLVNRFVDLMFLMDVALQFFLMYPEENLEGARWVFLPRRIARHYMLGWFPLDFSVVLVSVVDIIAVGEATQAEVDDELLFGLSKLKVVRTLRILRLIKLFRLLRMSRIFKRWESRMAINYARVALAQCIGWVLFADHLFACAWALQGEAFGYERHETWLGAFGLCWPRDLGANTSAVAAELEVHAAAATSAAAAGSEHAGYSVHGLSVCHSPGHLYVTSLYWSVMTVTSIGYGDIYPTLWSEQLVAVLVMLFGSLLWGQVVATFCGVVATFNPEATAFRNLMDDVNRFIGLHRLNGITPELKIRLREYFHQTKHLRLTLSHRKLLEQMSPMLQGEVAWTINERWLRRVWFLSGAEHAFVIQVALRLMPMVLVPGELAAAGYLYIIHRGIALYAGKVLTAGKIWGEDMILAETSLRRRWCARAMNYLEVYLLSRESLTQVAESFPKTARIIRRAALLLAMRRYLLVGLQKHRAEQAAERDKRGQEQLVSVAPPAAEANIVGGEGRPRKMSLPGVALARRKSRHSKESPKPVLQRSASKLDSAFLNASDMGPDGNIEQPYGQISATSQPASPLAMPTTSLPLLPQAEEAQRSPQRQLHQPSRAVRLPSGSSDGIGVQLEEALPPAMSAPELQHAVTQLRAEVSDTRQAVGTVHAAVAEQARATAAIREQLDALVAALLPERRP